MDYLQWIVAVALVEVTVALLVLLGLLRRVRGLEAKVAAPPPENPDDGVAPALEELTGRVERLAAAQERLAKLEGLEDRLPDLGPLETALAAIGEKTALLDRLEGIEERLARLTEREPEVLDLEGRIRPLLAEVVGELDERVRSLAADLEPARAESRGELLVRVLGERGFSEVTVVETTDAGEGRTRLVVEAKRDGMSFKGPVVIEADRVVEQKLRPSYPMFP